jgi:hypothetical protein
MSKRKSEDDGLQFYIGEFEDELAENKLLEALNFIQLRTVRAAFCEAVKALKEEVASKAKWPAKVKAAKARLSEIAPRHSELAIALKPGERPGEELAGLTAELNGLLKITWGHRSRTDRAFKALERLNDVLFLTSKSEWKRQTGQDRPRNVAELQAAMAEAKYSPDVVHDDGLTPRFAENYLLGFQRSRPISDGDPPEKLIPSWDHDTGELCFRNQVIRRVQSTKQAINVVRILDAFEEDGWPSRIDNPIGNDPAVMHDTIRSLKKGLSLIHFRADGTGEGIVWEIQSTAPAIPEHFQTTPGPLR